MKPVIDEVRMTMTVELYDDNDEEYDAVFPIKFEVCYRCSGSGSHTNPNIDGNGITQSEWENDWSYEEQEMYMSGGYDVTCEECGGKRVIAEIDEKRCTTDELKRDLERYHEHQSHLAEMYEIEAMERRYGA